MRAWYSGAKSRVAAIVAEVPSWLNWLDRAVWVMRAVRLISGDTDAVGRRRVTDTMSPTAAPAQNGHASGWEAALTVTDWTRFCGFAKTACTQLALSTSEPPAL